MKRLLSILICFVIVFSMFTTVFALGTNAAKSSPATTASKDPYGKYSSTVTLATVKAMNSTVRFNTSDPTQKSLTENVWASAYKNVLNVKLNYLWTPNSDEYDTKWNTALASGDIPDCAEIDTTIYKELLDAGLVADMSKYYNDYASDIYKQWNKADGNMTINFMTKQNKLYGLPILGTQPDDVGLLYIRKDWLKKVNMSEPKTIDDLINVAKEFTTAKLGGKDTYGICFNKAVNSWQCQMQGFLNEFGAYYGIWLKDSKTGNLVYSTIQPAMKTALLKLQGMYKDGLINQDFSVKDDATASQDIVSGKVGIEYGIGVAAGGAIMSSIQNDPSADWEVIVPPTSSGSKYVSQASSTPSTFLFVNKNCKHPEAVVKVVNLDVKLESTDPLHYSTTSKGVDVNKYRLAQDIWQPWKCLNNHNDIVPALASKNVSKLNPSEKSWYDEIATALSGKGTPHNIIMNIVFGKNSSYTLINQFKNNNQILVDSFQSFPTDTMVSTGSTLNSTLDSAIYNVIMGAGSSTFDNAVNSWKKGGGDKVTSEVNSWYKSH